MFFHESSFTLYYHNSQLKYYVFYNFLFDVISASLINNFEFSLPAIGINQNCQILFYSTLFLNVYMYEQKNQYRYTNKQFNTQRSKVIINQNQNLFIFSILSFEVNLNDVRRFLFDYFTNLFSHLLILALPSHTYIQMAVSTSNTTASTQILYRIVCNARKILYIF